MGGVLSFISNTSMSVGNYFFMIAFACLIIVLIVTTFISGSPFNFKLNPLLRNDPLVLLIHTFLLVSITVISIPIGTFSFVAALVWYFLGFIFGKHEQPTTTLLRASA